MTDQLDPHTHARRGDPDTSHAAAQQLDGTTMLRRLLLAYADHPDLTAEEAAEVCGYDAEAGAWKRCSDLANAGLVEDTGDRRVASTGRHQMARRITLAGIAALSTDGHG
jgi:hypothetical protein